jgi:hypothetical protein
MVTTETMQDYAHASTDTISRFRIVMACQHNVVEGQINDLIKTLADARAERARVVAVLSGLELVIAKR